MRWGVSLALAGELAEPAVIADIARVAEESGFDGVFVWDTSGTGRARRSPIRG